MDRRTFLGTMTAATVLSRQLAWAAGDHKIEKVGLQLYTIRSVMKDDFEGKLAKVSAIGYREVEFAGYDGHTPQEVRGMLDRHGLTGPVGAHSVQEPGRGFSQCAGRGSRGRPPVSGQSIY